MKNDSILGRQGERCLAAEMSDGIFAVINASDVEIEAFARIFVEWINIYIAVILANIEILLRACFKCIMTYRANHLYQ